MSQLSDIRIDKSAVKVFDSFEQAEAYDRDYWLSKSPLERLAACELLRQITYGYDPATARLPRFFEVVSSNFKCNKRKAVNFRQFSSAGHYNSRIPE